MDREDFPEDFPALVKAEAWKMMSHHYLQLLVEREKLCDGLRGIIEEKEVEILRLKKSLDKKIAKSECI